MKGLRTSAPSLAALVVGLLLVVLSVGCSKQNDDCAKPDTTTDGTARMMSDAPAGAVNTDPARPQGVMRDPLLGAGTEDEGISDDGDDEADGEGSNKRPKPN